MKKLMGFACATLVLLSVGLATGPANADLLSAAQQSSVSTASVAPSVPTSAPATVFMPMTGNYEYNCVLSNGSSYFMACGEKLTDCHGSYLQKYLDGRKLKTVNLTYGGVVATNPPIGWTWGTGCILSLAAAGAALVVFPPTGAIAWEVPADLSGLGIVASCVTF
jgi:hypothetical protein